MLNLLISLMSIVFIRKSIKTAEILPQWDFILNVLRFVVIALFLSSYTVETSFRPIFSFLWFIIFSAILYVLWLLKYLRIAKILLWAMLPFVIVNTFNNFILYVAPVFFDTHKAYFDFAMTGSLFWLAAFRIAAYYQQKALSKEEEKSKLILAERNSLEVIVKERTTEILLQKESLEKTLAELQATQNQLIQKEKLASLGELTAGIAHEIQNPLNFVNNFSELSVDLVKDVNAEINKETIDKDYVKDLMGDLTANQEKINHHGKRASSIVKGMLEHSRASTGERALTDINKLADEYLRLSYHGLRAKDKNFNSDYKTDFDESLPKLNVVPQDIGRVILNLINNAFWAVNEKNKTSVNKDYAPLVIVSTKRIGDKIEIIVKDNGNGIPDKIKEKIFQPFFTTKPTGEGTGLGLSLAYDIITKGHGGEIKVETKTGEFTGFIIILP